MKHEFKSLLFCSQCSLPCGAVPLWSARLQNMEIFQKKTKPTLALRRKGSFFCFVASLFCSCVSTFKLPSYPGQRRKKKLYLKMAHLPWDHDTQVPQQCLLFIEKCGSPFQLTTWGRMGLADLLIKLMSVLDCNQFPLTPDIPRHISYLSAVYHHDASTLAQDGTCDGTICACLALSVQWFLPP